jgi:hypothetical protein
VFVEPVDLVGHVIEAPFQVGGLVVGELAVLVVAHLIFVMVMSLISCFTRSYSW